MSEASDTLPPESRHRGLDFVQGPAKWNFIKQKKKQRAIQPKQFSLAFPKLCSQKI